MASENRKTHAGWTNYETWCVSQWLPTDQSTWELFRDQMQHQLAERTAENSHLGRFSVSARRQLKFHLAKHLRDAVEGLGYTDLPLIFADLLESGLARVNWPEIVEHFLTQPFPTLEYRKPVLASVAGPLFAIGRAVTAPAAQAAVSEEDVEAALYRHAHGDWGILEAADCRRNIRALAEELRVQSVYELENGTQLWVITEADRALTSVLLAEDY